MSGSSRCRKIGSLPGIRGLSSTSLMSRLSPALPRAGSFPQSYPGGRPMANARGPISPQSILLTDRVALVTGAGQGMGRAAAMAFSRLGARVAVCDRVPERVGEVAADLGPSSLCRVLDVREAGPVGSFVEEVAGRFGRVDIL